MIIIIIIKKELSIPEEFNNVETIQADTSLCTWRYSFWSTCVRVDEIQTKRAIFLLRPSTNSVSFRRFFSFFFFWICLVVLCLASKCWKMDRICQKYTGFSASSESDGMSRICQKYTGFSASNVLDAARRICQKYTGFSPSDERDAASRICQKYTGFSASSVDDAASRICQKYTGFSASNGNDATRRVCQKYTGFSPSGSWSGWGAIVAAVFWGRQRFFCATSEVILFLFMNIALSRFVPNNRTTSFCCKLFGSSTHFLLS